MPAVSRTVQYGGLGPYSDPYLYALAGGSYSGHEFSVGPGRIGSSTFTNGTSPDNQWPDAPEAKQLVAATEPCGPPAEHTKVTQIVLPDVAYYTVSARSPLVNNNLIGGDPSFFYTLTMHLELFGSRYGLLSTADSSINMLGTTSGFGPGFVNVSTLIAGYPGDTISANWTFTSNANFIAGDCYKHKFYQSAALMAREYSEEEMPPPPPLPVFLPGLSRFNADTGVQEYFLPSTS